ncbi:MAG TPA: type II secretion system protein [Candidatus Omnitrophota bacterium]|nr:type II secretion system protein [Candidatus Omnitrophota bacterium]HPD84856.1 type II secretion system protein [Candidatus Omnitrophota bacterium]HRZ03714.1 type II secretion system protein [Candidatus Omnitrophota bacterium]
MKNKGFTLIEILVIASIIAVLATIALVSLLRMFIAFNEASARNTIRTIASACEQYASFHGGEYPSYEGQLISPHDRPPYISEAFDRKVKHGYTIYEFFLNPSVYHLKARPVRRGVTGNNCFYMYSDQGLVLVSKPVQTSGECPRYDPPAYP